MCALMPRATAVSRIVTRQMRQSVRRACIARIRCLRGYVSSVVGTALGTAFGREEGCMLRAGAGEGQGVRQRARLDARLPPSATPSSNKATPLTPPTLPVGPHRHPPRTPSLLALTATHLAQPRSLPSPTERSPLINCKVAPQPCHAPHLCHPCHDCPSAVSR